MDNQETTQTTDSQVEEAIFGDEGLDPFAAAEEQQEPNETSIASPRTLTVQEQAPAPHREASAESNDEVRYSYWQSEADKRQNRITELENTNSKLQDTLLEKFDKPAEPTEEQQQSEPVRDEFPPPPEKPQRPQRFDRSEAYTDPQSESAQYLDTMDTWRDSMDEYNRLHVDYNSAVIQAEREEMQKQETDRVQARQAAEESAKRDSELRDSLRTDYNAAPEVIDDFISKMSDPESVTVENLWKLYQMDHGDMNRAQQVPVGTPKPQASETFKQTRNAQSIPSPMGVMPSSNREQMMSGEDRIMDDMIREYKAQNPFD